MTRRKCYVGRDGMRAPNDDLCEVCRDRDAPGLLGQAGIRMCGPCGRSYDRYSGDTPSDLIRWASRRARYFERKLQHRIRKTVEAVYDAAVEKAWQDGRESMQGSRRNVYLEK